MLVATRSKTQVNPVDTPQKPPKRASAAESGKFQKDLEAARNHGTHLLQCRASNRRGTCLWTFWIFARTLKGLIRTYFVSIRGSYLILSVRRYSSRTCSRETPHQRTTIISRLAVLSCYSLFSSSLSQFSLSSYSTAFVIPNNTHIPSSERLPSSPDCG